MKQVTIFCSANHVAEEYIHVAKRLGGLLVNEGFGIVWGGSNTGLMKDLADSVSSKGGKLVGVSVDVLKDVIRPNITETITTKTLGERKEALLAKGDAVVAISGGTGTLDELSTVIEEKKLGIHAKPLILLNTNHFYDDYLRELKKMYTEGFMVSPIENLVSVFETPEEVVQHIKQALG